MPARGPVCYINLDNVAQIVAYYLFPFIASLPPNLYSPSSLCLHWVFMVFYFGAIYLRYEQKLVGIFQLLIRHA